MLNGMVVGTTVMVTVVIIFVLASVVVVTLIILIALLVEATIFSLTLNNQLNIFNRTHYVVSETLGVSYETEEVSGILRCLGFIKIDITITGRSGLIIRTGFNNDI
ncbi:5503_t:CDS:1 [Gigaspora margarita]|uniref:5503_t:CDS:1 n=1 Tax=Gigaspora margarita TaxID=4874 RepID=A0ABN7UF92_GIGMA|nr:5503_t:CDS:1 [Gigaspora margarita]